MAFRSPLQRTRATIPGILLTITFAFSFIFSSLVVPGVTHAAGSAYVRVNQIGYTNGETKQAILMATGSEKGASFSVINTSTGKPFILHPSVPARATGMAINTA